MPWIAAAGSVAAAGIGAAASNSAAKKQQGAADAATQLQREQFQQTREDNLPALEARNAALLRMQGLADKYGGGMPTSTQVMAEPGYQFGLTQGRNALEGSAAAAGGLYSGATGKALVGYGNDYATGKYDQSFNRLQTAQTNDFNRWASISGQGQTGANQLATAGQNYANNAGNIGMSNANAQGAATIAQGNVFANGVNQAGSALKGWWDQPNPYTTPNAQGAYANPAGETSDYRGATMDNSLRGGGGYNGWADGGPVITAPKPGTRAPLRPGGTGGGLSDNALMMALAQQASQEPQPNRLMRGGNGLSLPTIRALKEHGEYAQGGPVYGPGGPQDDAIPVTLDDGSMGHLSNGEHVMNAPVVNAIGGGSNRLGQMRLNRLRMQLGAR